MKKILVPVDFSPASHNAYLYARAFAQTIGASLHLIHAYSGTFSTQDTFAIRAGKGRREAIEKDLKDFARRVGQQDGTVLTDLKVEVEAIHGLPVEVITQKSKGADVEYIVLSTTGAGNAVEKLLGSTSSGVAQKAFCPVLLIPKGVQFKAFKQLLYASNFESIQENALEQLVAFANIFQPNVHFVHIVEAEADNSELRDIQETILEELFDDDTRPYFPFTMSTIYNSSSVLSGLLEYSDQNDIDLLIIVNRQRGFLHNLLKNSLTKEMALRTPRPLMVFHFGEWDD